MTVETTTDSNFPNGDVNRPNSPFVFQFAYDFIGGPGGLGGLGYMYFHTTVDGTTHVGQNVACTGFPYYCGLVYDDTFKQSDGVGIVAFVTEDVSNFDWIIRVEFRSLDYDQVVFTNSTLFPSGIFTTVNVDYQDPFRIIDTPSFKQPDQYQAAIELCPVAPSSTPTNTPTNTPPPTATPIPIPTSTPTAVPPMPTPTATPSGVCTKTGASIVNGKVAGGAAVTMTLSGSGCTAVTTTGKQGNYKFQKVAAGTYTVTPAKSGCTFTPASATVTVGSNAKANFTATCQ